MTSERAQEVLAGTMAEPEKVEAEVEAPEGPASGSAKVGHVTGKSCFCGRGAFALIFHAV